MENILDVLERPVTNLDERVEETLVKFLQFLPRLIKYGDYSKCYSKGNLNDDISNYEVSNVPSFTFQFNYCTDEVEKIDRYEYFHILQSTNFISISSLCFHILFNYIKYRIENADEADYEFLTIKINIVIRTYYILSNNAKWSELMQISKTVENFVEFLIEIFLNFDTYQFIEKHGFHVLNTKLLLRFKKDAMCRNVIIDFIDKKLVRYVYTCQNEVHQDVDGTLENIVNTLIVLKIMLEYKFKPKEEILRTIITNLHADTSDSNICSRNDLIKMLQILGQYVPKYVQMLMEDCINTIQPGKCLAYYD